nr:uncharacterized protein LOC127332108 isoform X3 [Lolium perenne]
MPPTTAVAGSSTSPPPHAPRPPLQMATPPAQPMETSAAVTTTTVDTLKDDNIEEILLSLHSSASLARAALSSSHWRRVASSPDFLRRFRERHPSPPLLGLFVSQADRGQLPVFHPSATVRVDRDLAAAARGGDFLLTRLGHDPAWRLRDCRNGRLLLCRGDSLSVYDPVSRQHVAVRRPPNDISPAAAVSATEYLADCLLGGHGEPIRLVSVQRDGPRLRAMEYRSGTGTGWRCHPWVDGIDVATLRTPAMPAAAAGLIFWRRDQNSSLLLDTSTMAFSTVPLPAPLVVVSKNPLRPRPMYTIGDTEAGACCLVAIVGRATLQVWLLKKNHTGSGGSGWELQKQARKSQFQTFPSMSMVSAGLALIYSKGTKYSHFLIDLNNLSIKDKFLCHRSVAYPFQMAWPPAGFVPTSTPQTSACRDAEKQQEQEAPSSSSKRKSKDDETSSGKETMGPSIPIASLENEPSEKKVCYENGPTS